LTRAAKVIAPTYIEDKRMWKSNRLIAPGLVSVLLIAGCSSSKNVTTDEIMPDITVMPGSVDAVASAEPVGIIEENDLEPVTPANGYRSMSIQSMSTDADTPILILHQFINNGDSTNDCYLSYSLGDGTFSTLIEKNNRVSSYSISRDATTTAWLDESARTLVFEASSHDGQHHAYRAFFLTRTQPTEGLPEYVDGALLVDTDSGDITLLSENRYQRFYS